MNDRFVTQAAIQMMAAKEAGIDCEIAGARRLRFGVAVAAANGLARCVIGDPTVA